MNTKTASSPAWWIFRLTAFIRTTSCLIYTNTTSHRCRRASPPNFPPCRITSTAAKTGKFFTYRLKQAWAASSYAPHSKQTFQAALSHQGSLKTCLHRLFVYTHNAQHSQRQPENHLPHFRFATLAQKPHTARQIPHSGSLKLPPRPIFR